MPIARTRGYKQRMARALANKRDARAQVVALAKALLPRDLEAARRYLEYLRDFGGADVEGPADVEKAWTVEVKRRIDSLEAGDTQAEEWKAVRAGLKRRGRA